MQTEKSPLSRLEELGKSLIPIKQAARLIPSSRAGQHVSLSTLYRWKDQGSLRTVKVGGACFVPVEELVALLRGRQTEEAQPSTPPETSRQAERAGCELDAILYPARKAS